VGGETEHRHVACAASGRPGPLFRIHRSKTPLAAQIKNLCSEYSRHPLNPCLNLRLRGAALVNPWSFHFPRNLALVSVLYSTERPEMIFSQREITEGQNKKEN